MKASGTVETIGKIVTWILVVLLVLGIAGGAAYLAMKGSGASFYAETAGEKIFGGTERELTFSTGQTYDFSVRALEGGEINYSVKVTANPENNFDYVLDGKTYRFSGEDEERNDYSEVFALTRRADGFSLTIPEGVPNLCLHIKRSWEDFWYLWPITDTNGYLVDGWTFLTP